MLAAADGAAWLVLWLAGVAGRWSAEGAITMKTNMALGLTLGGISLFLMSWRTASSRRHFAAGFLAVAVLIIGGLTFSARWRIRAVSRTFPNAAGGRL
ncbi:MAG: hypothetical protein H6P95_821 [Candidatus Aminicenantes bacterium]|nr:hypothetical protein [Candidatus Aminicenantes bacterium]